MAQPQRPAGGGFNMAKLTMGQKGILIASLVLLISLFLPWQRVCVLGFCGSSSGLGGVGFLALILAIGLIVWELLPAFGVNANMGTFSPAMLSAIGAWVTAGITLINFLIYLGDVGFGAFIGLLAALALGYAGYLRFQESKATAPPPMA